MCLCLLKVKRSKLHDYDNANKMTFSEEKKTNNTTTTNTTLHHIRNGTSTLKFVMQQNEEKNVFVQFFSLCIHIWMAVEKPIHKRKCSLMTF